ncbi:MAG: hypothetical protein NT048_08140 [Flavobacterium sp.]|nr:hypothetical protein [Flavobacterium sp.]
MKFIIKIVICFSFWNGFTQVVFEKMPNEAKEIHFVYQKKSNYVINDEGIFADTLLLKIDFPDLKYTLRKHPKDSTIICGFSTLKKLGDINKPKLKGILYHTNETIYGIHFIPSKKTVFNVVRGDEETKMIFKKYFKERFINFEYREEFDFVNKTEKIKFPNVNYDRTFTEISKTIEFQKDESVGFYSEINKGVLFNNVVFFNNELSKFISPILFANSKFGVEKLETIMRTITLKSVTYK